MYTHGYGLKEEMCIHTLQYKCGHGWLACTSNLCLAPLSLPHLLGNRIDAHVGASFSPPNAAENSTDQQHLLLVFTVEFINRPDWTMVGPINQSINESISRSSVQK
jgi:hypothetical protein